MFQETLTENIQLVLLVKIGSFTDTLPLLLLLYPIVPLPRIEFYFAGNRCLMSINYGGYFRCFRFSVAALLVLEFLLERMVAPIWQRGLMLSFNILFCIRNNHISNGKKTIEK